MWFPDWPLRRPDAPLDRPCLVVESAIQRVVACNSHAAAAGVEAGMLRRQAEALCPTGVVLDRLPEVEAIGFEMVVSAVEEVTPLVEVAEPGLVFVPLQGAVRYYGSEAEVVERVHSAVGTHGGRIGVAGGPFAARCAAAAVGDGGVMVVGDDSGFLASLEVGALGDSDLVATLRWLGITTLGELSSLPRAALASRFGQQGIEVHRLAAGEDRDPVPRLLPDDPAVEQRFEDPLETLDQAGFAARRLTHQLVSGLARLGLAAHLVVVEAEACNGSLRHRVWRSADPFTESALADRVWWQLRAWIEAGGVPGGVARLRLAPDDLSGEGRQLPMLEHLWGTGGSEAWGRWQEVIPARMEAERSIARAQAVLGTDSVLVARPQGGRLPGDRVHWRPWGEPVGSAERDPGDPWPGSTPAPTPALAPPDPPMIEVEWEEGMPVRVRLGARWEPVSSWAGPWRLTGRWWKGESPADRYQIVTSVGAFLCLVREGRTYLVGVYD